MIHTHTSIQRSKDEWIFLCNGKSITIRTKDISNIIYCPLCNKNIRLELIKVLLS